MNVNSYSVFVFQTYRPFFLSLPKEKYLPTYLFTPSLFRARIIQNFLDKALFGTKSSLGVLGDGHICNT